MNVWWSRSPTPGNFGDVITPHILNHYGIAHNWTPISQAHAISTGSIIRHARPGQMVIGSGAMSRLDIVSAAADYRFVRGPITRNIVLRHGGQCPDVYGDPAMLLPRIFRRDRKPLIRVGMVPHYFDLNLAKGFVISPLLSPLEFLQRLWQCEAIISSSLHGIIAAHAYGIPAAWVKLSNRLDGDDAKFHDHAQSVGLDCMPLSTVEKPIFTLARFDDSAIDKILRGLGGH